MSIYDREVTEYDEVAREMIDDDRRAEDARDARARETLDYLVQEAGYTYDAALAYVRRQYPGVM